MPVIHHRRIFHINSGTQLTGLNNTFTTFLQLPDGQQYDRITVLSANIPVSYYVIQQGQNTFTLTENGTSTLITITPSNYNISSFCYTIQNLLNSASPNAYSYSLLYPQNYKDPNTGKISYYVKAGNNSQISFTFPVNSPLNQQFGFNSGVTDTFIYQGSQNYLLVSSNVCSFVPENSLFLHTNLIDGRDSPSYKFSSCLQEIYNANIVPFGVLGFQNPAPYETSRRFIQSNSSIASFSLTDENGNPILMNGLDIVLTIMIFKIHPVYDEIHRSLESFNQYNFEGILDHIVTKLDEIASGRSRSEVIPQPPPYSEVQPQPPPYSEIPPPPPYEEPVNEPIQNLLIPLNEEEP